jgi:hypothetical protein
LLVSPNQRKQGLFKKAYELGVLCSVDVAVIIFGLSLSARLICTTGLNVYFYPIPERRQGTEKLFQYCSGDITAVVHKQSKVRLSVVSSLDLILIPSPARQFDGERSTQGPGDFNGGGKGGGGSGGGGGAADDDGDGDDDDDVDGDGDGDDADAGGASSPTMRKRGDTLKGGKGRPLDRGEGSSRPVKPEVRTLSFPVDARQVLTAALFSSPPIASIP